MLEDIKNIMNSKRQHSNVSHAQVQDTRTGEVYDVKTDSDFLFGRFLKSSIVIEELYISRSHSTIRYENDKFLLKDNNSCTGTYLNYRKISKEVVLQNGDLIAFTDKSKTWDFVYKFCLLSNPNKKLKLEEKNSTEKEIDHFKKTSMEQIQNLVKELQASNSTLKSDCKAAMDEFKKSVENTTEENSKLNDVIIKLRDQNEETKNQMIIYRRRCILQRKLLDSKMEKEEESLETFKTQIFQLLENDFQCPICNELVFRSSIANCGHTFCDCCLKSWLNRSKHCPSCRSIVSSTTSNLSLDDYITNVCDFLGGTIKEQRLNLQKERNGPPPQTAKRGRKKAGSQSTRGRREPPPPPYILMDDNPIRNNSRFPDVLRHDVIEIVDLTNNTSR